MKRFVRALFAAAAAMGMAGLAHAGTLDTVKQRGALTCGANGQLPGFGLPDAQGNWTGLDVDFCRSIAAAIFNDANKVKFVTLTAKDRFTALQTGDVDVLVRNTTWTHLRDTQLGLNGTGINYYDGQGFIIRRSAKVNSALELNDATICVQQGTTTELNLADYFRGKRPSGVTTGAKVDLGMIVRDIDELVVLNDEAHHIHDPRMAWFKSIQDILTPSFPSPPLPLTSLVKSASPGGRPAWRPPQAPRARRMRGPMVGAG